MLTGNPTTLLLALVQLAFASGWDINSSKDRAACQAPTHNPLEGCDRKSTVLVSKNGNFKTIQSAVLSLPNDAGPYTILITSGNYTEQVNITRPGPTYLLGQTTSPVSQASNTVSILWAAIAVPGLDNAFTSTLTVAPTLNSSLTGSGPTGFPVPASTPFGSVDFRTYNLDLINNFAPYSDSPSLAVSISYANGGFYHTGFYSYQDTVYVGKLGNAYFSQSVIAGQTDFLYGFGTAFITNSTLLLRSCGGGITAWKGTNTTFENKYGVYISNSVLKAENATVAAKMVGKCALGRPWNAQMRSVIAKSYFDASILPTGFIDWVPARYNSNVTLQAEYQNYGPGWNETARKEAKFERLLTEQEWKSYSCPKKVFQYQTGRREGEFGNDGWVDYGV